MQAASSQLDWTHWLLRMVVSNDPAALADLRTRLASQTGAEADAIGALLTSYAGAGTASAAAYDAVAQLLAGRPREVLALEVFRLHDRIASDPGNLQPADVQAGLALADQLSEPGVRAYFQMLDGQLAQQRGDLDTAKQLTVEALGALLALAQSDRIYITRLADAAQNTVAFAAMDGDLGTARAAAQLLTELGQGDRVAAIGPPVEADTPAELSERGSDLLEAGDPLRALDCFKRAEALMHEDAPELCGMLGDMAVAYRRLGNHHAAVVTYRRAIAACVAHGDDLNLSRWSNNLVAILSAAGDDDGAAELVPTALAAAVRTGDPVQVGVAATTVAGKLVAQGRFAEAVAALEDARRNAGDDEDLDRILRHSLADARLAAGHAAWRDQRADAAAAQLEAALALLDDTQADEALRARLLLAEISQRRGDDAGYREHLHAARDVAQEVGDDGLVEVIDRELGGSGGTRIAEPGTLPPVAQLRAQIAAAVADGDEDGELTGRTNLAVALLDEDFDAALEALDDVLERVQARGDRRRELMLCLNFIPRLIEAGENTRAVRLAERCEPLAAGAAPPLAALAHAARGDVAAEVLHDHAAALAAYREVLAVLDAANDVPENVISGLTPSLARAASLALAEHDTDLAEAIARVLGLELPEDAEPPPGVDVATLATLSNAELDAVLGAWRAGEGREAMQPVPPELPGWAAWFLRADARLQAGAGVVAAGASAGGPAGLVHLAGLLQRGEIDYVSACRAATALAVDPEDAAALTAHALHGSAGGAVAALVAETTTDDALAARLLRYQMMAAAGGGDHERALAFGEAALERLAHDADEPLRVDVLNETAVQLSQLQRHGEALLRSREAAEAAERIADARMIGMARGNEAMAMMALGRPAEALPLLEALERDQLARGEHDMAQITEFNKRLAQDATGIRTAFAGDSEDPDEVFQAAIAADRDDDHYAAIRLFERGFALVEAGAHSYTSDDARQFYSAALAASGRTEEALDQLERIVERFARGNPAHAARAAITMVSVARRSPARARAYARRALTLAEASGNAAVIADARVVLAATAEATGDIDAARAGLEGSDSVQAVLRLAALDAERGDPQAALAALDRLGPMDDEDAIRATLVRAAAHRALGDSERELELLEQAVERERDGTAAARALGSAHLRAGRAAEAVATLETAAGRAGIAELGIELGQSLAALGDGYGADRILGQVADAARAGGDELQRARALAARGTVRAARGALDAAREDFLVARNVARDVGDQQALGAALDGLGIVHQRAGRPGQAVELHQAAIDVYARSGAAHDELIAWLNLAHAHCALRDNAAAEAALVAAMDLDADPGPYRWQLMFVAAIVDGRNGHWSGARDVLRQLLEAAHSNAPTVTPGEARQSLRVEEQYHRMAADAAVEAGDARFALEVLEARRARFLRSVQARRASRAEGVSDAVWRRYEQAADALAAVRARHREQLITPDPASAQALSAAEREHAEAFSAAFGAGQAPPAQVVLRPFDELTAALAGDTAVAYVDAHPDGLEIVCAGAGWAHCRLAKTLTLADIPPEAQLRGGGAALEQACALLGERLWPPLLELLPTEIEHLILLPSALLAGLPLAAARLPDGRRAGERLRVAFAPSLTLLGDAPAPAGGVLGQAVDPTADLPFTTWEAEQVAGLYAERLPARIGGEATVAAVLELLRGCDVLHFAGHATFDGDDPLRSWLRCADGRLTVSRILDEVGTLRARIVALSACASGAVAGADPLDELVGLPGTLLAAGAQVVLATLWEVGDLESALITAEFFRRAPAAGPAAALASAQAWFRDELSGAEVAERTAAWARAHPSDERLRALAGAWAARTGDRSPAFPDAPDWAAFCVVGNPRRPA